ncbi:MAG TPA: hypothetical protein VE779_06440 [Candidatus Angelobacter sp.]|nr:hypothetical protein [Candidatus Angelobacter sp.]
MNVIPTRLVAALLVAAMPILSHSQQTGVQVLTHTHNEFAFAVHAPLEKAFPLFGAIEERNWAEGWLPTVLYPSPARDQQGMVFRVEHSHMSATWTCTAFDAAAGHVQYVCVVADAMVTLIDIHLTQAGAAETHVSVTYERTALTPEANDHVAHLAKGDAQSGPDWETAINNYLAKPAAK